MGESQQWNGLAIGTEADESQARSVAAGDAPGVATTSSAAASDVDPVATPVVSVSDVVISEADGTATFVLSLSAPGLQNVTVNYSVVGDTASSTSSADFTAVSGTVVFPAGSSTAQTITVPITENLSVEAIEAFNLNLSVPVGGNAVLAQTSVRGTIVDNDTAVTTPNVSVRDVTVDEKAGVATFVVALDGVRSDGGNVSVNYTTANGTATAGSDFTAASGILTFGAGETVKTIQVALTDDLTAEGAELFALNLSAAVGATIADGSATARIGASDAATTATAPVVSVSDVIVSEADGWVDYVFTLSAPSAQVTTINYSVIADTASGTSSSDFTALSGSLSFAPGVTTQTLRVPVTNDTGVESTENFNLNLSVPVGGNAVLAQTSVRGTIVDNDTAVTTPNVSVRDVTVDEKAGVATFVVALDGVRSDGGNVSVNYTTANGTATAGSDFTAASGILTFGAGETVKTIQVALTDDLTAEGAERFDLSLTSATGAAIADARGTASIGANDGTATGTPTLTVANVSVSEGSGWADFTFQLSAPGTLPSTVNYSVVSNTASGTSSTDFTPISGAMTFQPGVTTLTLRVPIGDGTTAESLEDFRINLSVPVGGNLTLAQTQVIGTIIDDDIVGGQVLAYGTGNDTYIVDQAADVVVENVDAGTDTVQASVTRMLEANVENLTLTGSAALNGTGNELNNVLNGNSGNNVLTGLAGRDTLNGGAGADTLVGGTGNDTYTVNSGTDRITEVANEGTDTVQSSVSWTLGTALERLTLTGSNAINATGNSLANTLTGNAAANVIDGKAALDTLTGGAGDDTFAFSTTASGDVITDFVSGVDRIRLDQAVFAIGDGDAVVEGAVSVAGPGGFGAAAEFVVLTQDIVGSITTASAAAAIGSALDAYAIGDRRVFAVDNGSQSAVYLFTAADADAAVSASELTLIATLSGTAGLATADLLLQAGVAANGRYGPPPMLSPTDHLAW